MSIGKFICSSKRHHSQDIKHFYYPLKDLSYHFIVMPPPPQSQNHHSAFGDKCFKKLNRDLSLFKLLKYNDILLAIGPFIHIFQSGLRKSHFVIL